MADDRTYRTEWKVIEAVLAALRDHVEHPTCSACGVQWVCPRCKRDRELVASIDALAGTTAADVDAAIARDRALRAKLGK